MSRRDDSANVFDLTGLGRPLPLALARAAGASRESADLVATCGACGVRYFARPKGSPLVENGLCRGCATEAAPTPASAPSSHVRPFQRPARAKGARR